MAQDVTSLTLIIGLLVGLQIKHLLCDFPLQTLKMIEGKGIYGHPLGLLHALTHCAGSAIVFLVASVPIVVALTVLAAEFVFHYHLDWGKEQLNRRLALSSSDKMFWTVFGIDQMLHHLSYLAIVAYIASA